MNIAMTRLHAFFSHFLLNDLLFSGQSKKKCTTDLASRIRAYLVSKTNFTLAESVCIWNAIFSVVGEK
jgi:hypothetical protein